MKILKIFGIVAGIHVFALVLIFANPGCSSTSKRPPSAADTAVASRAEPAPQISVPTGPSNYAANSAPSSAGAMPSISFNPDAPAVAAPTSGESGGRYVPTRPGTPAAGAVTKEPVSDVTPAATYTVKSGDSLWTIAKKNHLSVADLRAANNLPANANLHPGQKLLIPGKATPSSAAAASAAPAAQASSAPAKSIEAAPAPAPARNSASGVKHVVKSGETLGTIARHYGVKASDIAVANNISDPAKIKAGTELIIPGWETPGGKSAKSSTPKSGSAKAPSETKPAPATEPAQPPPAETTPANQPPPVPVIRIDESPLTPAPKS
jgi:LysM repeat protein